MRNDHNVLGGRTNPSFEDLIRRIKALMPFRSPPLPLPMSEKDLPFSISEKDPLVTGEDEG